MMFEVSLLPWWLFLPQLLQLQKAVIIIPVLAALARAPVRRLRMSMDIQRKMGLTLNLINVRHRTKNLKITGRPREMKIRTLVRMAPN